MISQACSKAGTPTRGIELGRQQLGRISLADDVLEFEVRTPIESFPENVSERKDKHTRLIRLGLHGTSLVLTEPVLLGTELFPVRPELSSRWSMPRPDWSYGSRLESHRD